MLQDYFNIYIKENYFSEGVRVDDHICPCRGRGPNFYIRFVIVD